MCVIVHLFVHSDCFFQQDCCLSQCRLLFVSCLNCCVSLSTGVSRLSDLYQRNQDRMVGADAVQMASQCHLSMTTHQFPSIGSHRWTIHSCLIKCLLTTGSGTMARANVITLTMLTCRQSLCLMICLTTSWKRSWTRCLINLSSTQMIWQLWQRSMVLTRQTSCHQQSKGCQVPAVISVQHRRHTAVNL